MILSVLMVFLHVNFYIDSYCNTPYMSAVLHVLPHCFIVYLLVLLEFFLFTMNLIEKKIPKEKYNLDEYDEGFIFYFSGQLERISLAVWWALWLRKIKSLKPPPSFSTKETHEFFKIPEEIVHGNIFSSTQKQILLL